MASNAGNDEIILLFGAREHILNGIKFLKIIRQAAARPSISIRRFDLKPVLRAGFGFESGPP
jgi:hypothetical protein